MASLEIATQGKGGRENTINLFCRARLLQNGSTAERKAKGANDLCKIFEFKHGIKTFSEHLLGRVKGGGAKCKEKFCKWMTIYMALMADMNHILNCSLELIN
jgi:hypothetical protein